MRNVAIKVILLVSSNPRLIDLIIYHLVHSYLEALSVIARTKFKR